MGRSHVSRPWIRTGLTRDSSASIAIISVEGSILLAKGSS